eukprot:GHVN01022493.1.p2 GENE.GHVN01022493.1~~GHVN01022493.1.p2  ORF type:complete len:107 (-),score=14.22 GHVN01022493.1:659-979(-)
MLCPTVSYRTVPVLVARVCDGSPDGCLNVKRSYKSEMVHHHCSPSPLGSILRPLLTSLTHSLDLSRFFDDLKLIKPTCQPDDILHLQQDIDTILDGGRCFDSTTHL